MTQILNNYCQIIYELLAACVYYAFINASLAELASSIPSSAGGKQIFSCDMCRRSSLWVMPVYHYASVTPGPRWGRLLGFFAGSINFFGWLIGLTSLMTINSTAIVEMYAIFHPGLVIQPWHVFLTLVVLNWATCFFVIYFNGVLPRAQSLGLVFIIGAWLVVIVTVLAATPRHASSAFVWREWTNSTGWLVSHVYFFVQCSPVIICPGRMVWRL
jgi:choline transport protein